MVVLPSEFVQKKEERDAVGRHTSSGLHLFNVRYPSGADYLACSGAEKAEAYRQLLGFPATGGAPRPPRHALETYWAAYIKHLWRLLHVGFPALDPSTPEGSAQRDRILLVICRMRWLHALVAAMDRRHDGTDWPTAYAFLTFIHEEEMSDQDSCEFVPFMTNLVTAQRTDLLQGTAPNLHDDLQSKLASAARRALLDSWFAARAPPSEPLPAAPPARRDARRLVCTLCNGNHLFEDHPSGAPITKFCGLCGVKHARYGPLASPCGPKAE
jgi:hypothetical protein